MKVRWGWWSRNTDPVEFVFCGGGFMLREGGFMLSTVDSCFATVGWVSGILLCSSGWWWLGSRGCADIVVMGFLVGGGGWPHRVMGLLLLLDCL
ncbi:hypothetical protein FCV25MIE_09607 [Fagus crenata]